MTNLASTQLQKRQLESVSHLFTKTAGEKKILFLTSSTDEGVIRNFGRNGAKYAPKALLNTFKKFSLTPETQNLKCLEFEVSLPDEEKKSFEKAQILESEQIKSLYEQHPNSPLLHIGGGHDHIFPLLKAVTTHDMKVIVINIDAHADTRVDSRVHSGTPFRQFSDTFEGNFLLYQIGLNRFANSSSTLSPLKKHKMNILWQEEITSDKEVKNFFAEIKQNIDKSTRVIFSIDADALSGTEVPGVSALNPTGINQTQLKQFYDEYLKLGFDHDPIVGLYELNPVFDTLSGQSMRVLSAFIFDVISK